MLALGQLYDHAHLHLQVRYSIVSTEYTAHFIMTPYDLQI